MAEALKSLIQSTCPRARSPLRRRTALGRAAREKARGNGLCNASLFITPQNHNPTTASAMVLLFDKKMFSESLSQAPTLADNRYAEL